MNNTKKVFLILLGLYVVYRIFFTQYTPSGFGSSYDVPVGIGEIVLGGVILVVVPAVYYNWFSKKKKESNISS